MDVEPLEAIVGVALIVAITWGLFMVHQATGIDLIMSARDKAESLSHTIAFTLMYDYYWNTSSDSTPDYILNKIKNFLAAVDSHGTWVNFTIHVKNVSRSPLIWEKIVYTSSGEPKSISTNIYSFVPVNGSLKATPDTTTLWIRTSSDKYDCDDLDDYPILVYIVPYLPDGSTVGGNTTGPDAEFTIDASISIEDQGGGSPYTATCEPITPSGDYFVNGIFVCKFQTTDNLCYLLNGQPSTPITVNVTVGYKGKLLAQSTFSSAVLSNDPTARFDPSPKATKNAFFIPYDFTVQVVSPGGGVSGDYEVRSVYKGLTYVTGHTTDGTITVSLPPPAGSDIRDFLRTVHGLYVIEFQYAPDNNIYRPFIVYPFAVDVEVQAGVGG